jgi:hypothetical protein
MDSVQPSSNGLPRPCITSKLTSDLPGTDPARSFSHTRVTAVTQLPDWPRGSKPTSGGSPGNHMPATARTLLAAVLLGSAALATTASAQNPLRGFALELHSGYGGGGRHSDGLLGGGLIYHLDSRVDAAGFMTAVAARPEGRAVFAGLGLRLGLGGAIRPYVEAGPLLSVRSYAAGQLGTFAKVGVDAALEPRSGPWRVFLEGRAMEAGGSWTQVVAGIRYH